MKLNKDQLQYVANVLEALNVSYGNPFVMETASAHSIDNKVLLVPENTSDKALNVIITIGNGELFYNKTQLSLTELSSLASDIANRTAKINLFNKLKENIVNVSIKELKVLTDKFNNPKK